LRCLQLIQVRSEVDLPFPHSEFACDSRTGLFALHLRECALQFVLCPVSPGVGTQSHRETQLTMPAMEALQQSEGLIVIKVSFFADGLRRCPTRTYRTPLFFGPGLLNRNVTFGQLLFIAGRFGFDDGDVQVFENYVNRQWCFVVAKVQPEPGTQERQIVAGKMVAPLILRFKTDKAVSPLALTSTIGAETEVLLYTLSEKKLTCGERLTLRRATKIGQWNFSDLVGKAGTEAAALFADVPKSATLCKFKKRLKPEEMKEDIVFDLAPDNESYRETRIVW